MTDLPPELAALITAERAVKVASAAERVAVRAKLATTVGAAPLGSLAVGATLAGTGKALAIVALTLAAGGGALLALRGDAGGAPSRPAPTHAVVSAPRTPPDVAPPSEAVIAMAPVPAPAPPSNPSPSRGVDVRRAQRVAPREATPMAAPPEATAPESTPAPTAAELVAPAIPSQVELVRAAWAALSAGDAVRALALADEDAQARRAGPLAEEREAVRVIALARLRRTADAQRLATRFLTLYPTSVHRALIQRAVADRESR